MGGYSIPIDDEMDDELQRAQGPRIARPNAGAATSPLTLRGVNPNPVPAPEDENKLTQMRADAAQGLAPPTAAIAQPTPARIARPPAPSTIPPLTLRGLGAPAATADDGTADLEGRKSADIAAMRLGGPPRPIPSPVEERTTADQNELQRQQRTGSGISQIQHGSPEGGIGIAKPHPILGGILRGLNVAGEVGSALLPELGPVMRAIPGTEEHHNYLMRQQGGRIAEDLGEQKEQAGIAETGAKTEESAAAAEKDRAEAAKARRPGQTKLVFDQGIPVAVERGEEQYAVGAPNMPPDLKTFADAAVAAHKERLQEAADVAAEKPNVKPVGDESAQQYNASILRELNVNPKTAQKEIPPEYKVNATDTDAQAKEKMQRTKDLVGGATGQQHITVQTGQQGNARSDKSYQLQSTRLDKLRTPVDQLATRFSRLTDTLNAKSPQADALVAPELLSVMAGGQGSGVRMNEAEIARIVGGRSAWQNLQATIQHWSTNPEAARSITPEQDKQIRDLIAAVHTKVTAKQAILQKAEEALLDSDNPQDHRRIIAGAEKQLNDIDAGGAGGGGTVNMKAPGPHGAIKPVPADQVDHYKSLGATVAE